MNLESVILNFYLASDFFLKGFDMTAIQTNKRLTAKILLQVSMAAVMFGALLTLGWWAGETGARRLDAQIREQLLRQAEVIARAVNPGLAKKLSFTAADKGSPAFETIREQLIADNKNISQLGIFSMAVRDGEIVLGPESYQENDPRASLPGTVYKKPNPENRQVLQTGKPMVAGPYTDEYGTFVTALSPVLDLHSGAVLMVVGVDVMAADWDARLSSERRKPLLMTGTLLLLLVGGAVAIRRRNRRIIPGRLKLRRWIITPSALVILAGVMLYAAYGYREFKQLSHRNMTAMLDQARSRLNSSINTSVELLCAQIDHIDRSADMRAAWQARDFAALSGLAQRSFAPLRDNYKITHCYFIEPDGNCFLRAHQPERRGDRITRSTLLTAQRTGEDSWGIELGRLGAFTLRYVRPWKKGGATIGYLELGIEIKHLTAQLASDMNIELLSVITKEYISRENFEEGKKAFGFLGRWDDYPNVVVAHQTVQTMPDAVARMLAHDLTAASSGEVFSTQQGDKWFTCGVIQLPDAAGRAVGSLIIIRDVTADADARRSAAFLNMGLSVGLLSELLMLLWLVTGTAEQQLGSALVLMHESEALFHSLFDNALSGIAIHKIIVDEQGKPVDYVFLQANPAFERHTGLRVADVLGRRVTDVLPHVKDSPLIETYGKVALTGQTVVFEQFVEQQQFYYTISAFQLGPGQFATVFQNITERKKAEEALQAEKDNRNAIFESSPVGMLLLDENLIIIDANLNIAHMIGKTPSHILEKRIGAGLGCIHSAEHEQGCGFSPACRLCSLRDAILSVLKTDRPVQGAEIQPNLLMGGMPYRPWLLVSVEPLLINGRKHFIVAAANITQRKLAEEKILLNEVRLQSLLKILQYKSETVHDLLDYALNEAITLTASQFGYIFFYDENKQEFVLNTWSAGVMEACAVREQRTMYQLEQTGLWGEAARQRKPVMVNDFEAANPLKKGYPEGHAALHAFLSVPIISQGRIVAVIGVANKAADYDEADILQLTLLMDVAWKVTERKKADEALRENQEKFSKAFDSSPVAVTITLLENGQFLEVNKTFEKQTGYSRDEVIGKNGFELGLFSDPQAALLFRQAVAANGACSNFEISMLSKTGQKKIGLLSAEVIQFGGQSCILTVGEDITERRRVEAELGESVRILSEVQQVAHIATWTLNIVTGERCFSDETYCILGLPVGSPLSFEGYTQCIHPDDFQAIQDVWSNPDIKHTSVELEYRLIRPSGEIRIVHEYSVYKYDEDGQIRSLATMILDITERKQAEDALRLELTERKRVEVELKQTEGLLTDAQQIAHMGTWTFDGETGQFLLSDGAYRILGLPIGSALSFGEFPAHVHPDDIEVIAHQWSALNQNNSSFDIEYRIIRPSGEIRAIHEYTTYRTSDEGLVVHSAALLQDITERKQAEDALKLELDERRRVEEALHESESILSGAQQIAHIGTWTYNLKNGVFRWSDEVNRILDLPTENPLSYSDFSRYVHPDDYQKIAQAWNGLIKENSSGEVEYRIMRPSGEIRYIHEYIVIHTDASGQFESSASLLQDVTESRQAEDKLRQLSQAVEQSPASIVITDPSGVIEYVNPRFVELTGYTLAEALGQNPCILKSGDKPPEAYKELWETIIAGRQWRGEFYNKKKSGELYWESASISPIRDTGGCITHFLAVKEDITQRKQAEDELKAINLQLEKTIARANEMTAQAEMANVAKSEFLANMSHEIRTPMNGVIGMTGLLLDTELSVEQLQYARIVRSSGEALMGLINDILDFSKIEAGKLDLETLDFDLRTTLEDTAELLAVKAREKGLELVCLVDPEVPVLLRGDPGRLRQIFVNLGGNAVKFTHKGAVSLHASLEAETEQQATLRFVVTDTGIGIPRNKQQMLFTPFTQVDGSTTRKYGGTGLGLSISKQLVELMGGAIGLESKTGMGSTFWFTAVFEKQPAGQSPEVAPLADLTGIRVLVVDDHAINRLLVMSLLKTWGCRFDEVADGNAALDRMQEAVAGKDPYRIALLDMHMPGMDGAELGRRIKESPDTSDTLLIMMTSLGERGDIARMAAIGFGGYLTKPLRQTQLRDCMAMVLGRVQMLRAATASDLVTRHTVSEARKRRTRILVAEDNATNQLVALKILEKLGYRADAVADGREALAALRDIPYDLVLMDCQMPGMDGFETTRSIRSANSAVRNHKVTIIAMTAHAMQGDRERCLEAGMDDYLSKPVEPAQLAAVLERWLPDSEPDNEKLEIVIAKATAEKQEAGKKSAENKNAEISSKSAIFDRDAFLSRLMNDEGMARVIVEGFLADMPVQIELLAEAVAAADSTAAGQQAHKIKGAAANMAAEALRAAAAQTEQAGNTKNVKVLPGLLHEIESCFKELKEAMKSSKFKG